MIQTINLYQFRDAFQRHSRTNFSYEGLEVLFDYLEECDPDYDLDVVELCCDYAEGSALSIAAQYGIEAEDEDELHAAVLEYLEDHTNVIGSTDETIVYLQF